MKAAAAALAEIITLFESVPLDERSWLAKNLRAYVAGSNGGSKPVQTRFSEPVHGPGSDASFEQESSRFFLQFWTAFPKKQGKKEALRIYQKLNPDQELQDRILKAIEEQKASEQWTTENGRFIPLPKTWLNQGRWDDEPSVQTANEPRFGRTKSSVFKRFIQGGPPEIEP